MTETAIELEYRVELADYLAANEHHWRSQRFGTRENVRIGVLGLLIACVVGYVLSPWWYGLAIGVPSGALLTMVWIRRVRYKHFYKHEPKCQQTAKLKFSDCEIQFQSEGVDSKLGWSLYSRYSETPDHFLIYYGRNAFSIVPKDALNSADKEDQFRALLIKKLGAPT